MVDLDSLVEFGVWGLNEPANRRYTSLQRSRGQRTIKTPLDLVFKQVVVIAEAWIREVTDDKTHVDKLVAASDAAQNWTRDASQVCDGPYIMEALKGYRDQFGVRED